jgi:hypothetical protein
LVGCRGEDYCFDHHPRSARLMTKAPTFRVVIYDDNHLRHVDPFAHFMEHRDRYEDRGRRPFPFV